LLIRKKSFKSISSKVYNQITEGMNKHLHLP
jgi:hypothetical protein